MTPSNNTQLLEFTITTKNKNLRLDHFLQQEIPDFSRSQLQNLIKTKQVSINGEYKPKNYKLAENDSIQVHLSNSSSKNSLDPIAEKLDIIYQDNDILAINKPPFLPVHPDSKTSHPKTLVNILLGNNIPLSSLGGNLRPGIVHRLDMDTSGLILIAKTDSGYKTLRQQFQDHTITKKYICLTTGQLPSKSGLIKAPIARNPLDRKKMAIQNSSSAKAALSKFKIIETFYSEDLQTYLNLTEVQIITGRTHQIRVHFSSINHPLLGDTTYGNKKLNLIAKKHGLSRQFLHATELIFKDTKNQEISLSSPLPSDLQNFFNAISKT